MTSYELTVEIEVFLQIAETNSSLSATLQTLSEYYDQFFKLDEPRISSHGERIDQYAHLKSLLRFIFSLDVVA